MKLWIFLSALALLFTLASADRSFPGQTTALILEKLGPKKKPNCVIHVQNVKKKGRKQRQTYSFTLKSKEKCKTAAETYESESFAGKSGKVTFEWFGGD